MIIRALILSLLFPTFAAAGWNPYITGIRSQAIPLSPENRLLYSNDYSNTYWTKYGAPTFSTNPDGSIKITQTTASGTFVREYNLGQEVPCIESLNSYVLRARLNPYQDGLIQPYGGISLTNALLDDLVTPVNINQYARPYGTVPYAKFVIPFNVADTTYLAIVGDGSVAKNIDVLDLQIVANPGYTLYSAGDSICEWSLNYDFDTPRTGDIDSVDNYTYFYAYDNNIVAFNDGLAGDLLSEIYTRMQASLTGKTYPIIFVEGGINDINAVTITPLVDMQTTMSNMITLAKSHADKVVVFTIPPNTNPIGTDLQQQLDYNAWLATEAASQGVQLFDMVAVLGDGSGTYGLGRNYLYYTTQEDPPPDDNNHPNAAGHQALADALSAQVTLPPTAKYTGTYITTTTECVQ